MSAVNLDGGICRVDTGNNTTDWLHWLTARASKTRSWNAPPLGEKVLVVCLGGELDTDFVMPAVFSDDNSAPPASADALHWSFPDGPVIKYEPATGALTATGMKTATIEAADSVTVKTTMVLVSASEKITFDSPLVECTQKLVEATFELTGGGSMKGNITNSGGSLASNGIV